MSRIVIHIRDIFTAGPWQNRQLKMCLFNPKML